MKLAILADIHGNAAALEAVLEDVADQRPDRIVLNGDLLAFGPEPRETVSLLRRLDVPSTRGNTERWLTDASHEKRSPGVTNELFEALCWTVAEVGPVDLEAFTDMPFALVGEPVPVQLYHASPAGDEEGIWPSTPDGEIPALLGGTPEGTFVVSHTHLPGERVVGDLRVLNTGSVGFPFDGDTRACYLVLEGDRGSRAVHATWRRVSYDRERALAAIRERGVPMASRLTARIQTGEF